MAALLYLGAGTGIGILSLFNRRDRARSERLTGKDMPYVIGMIVLDIAAPVFLMLGISYGSSANASLLGNFEIVATTVIALLRQESLPGLRQVGAAQLLGFVAYGLSIFLYVRAQNILGAAKASAYYAVAPFAGAFMSFVFLRERLSWSYLAALDLVAQYVTNKTHGHRHTNKELEGLPGATHP